MCTYHITQECTYQLVKKYIYKETFELPKVNHVQTAGYSNIYAFTMNVQVNINSQSKRDLCDKL